MKRMKRILSALIAVLSVGVLLTGCHGSKGYEPFVIPEVFDDAKQYNITFWAKNDTNKNQVAVYEQAKADFEALYPNIHVQIRLYTDYERIYNDVITNIATGTTPNVCITYPDHIATYLTAPNTVVPLDALFTDGRFGLAGSEVRFDAPTLPEIVPEYLDEGLFSGAHYAIPYMRSTEACYINKTFVEQLGYTVPDELTWDFVWEVADAAAEKNADGTYKLNGQTVMIPFIYKSTDNMMIQLLKQSDGGYSNEDGTIEIFNDTTKQHLETVADHTRTGAFSTFKISSYPANFLNAGQCIFAIDSTAGATWMGTDAPLCDIAADKIVRFDTVVRTVPQLDPSHPQMISQGPSICIFNKEDPGEVLASWLFSQYLLSDRVQIGYAETEGYVPVTTKAQQNPEYLEYLALGGTDNTTHYSIKIEASELLIDNIENTFVTPVFNGSAALRNAAGQLIENTVKSVRRRETVDDAYFDRLFDDVNALYRLDQVAGHTSAEGKSDLGELPDASKALLITLVCVWVVMGAIVSAAAIRKRKKAQ